MSLDLKEYLVPPDGMITKHPRCHPWNAGNPHTSELTMRNAKEEKPFSLLQNCFHGDKRIPVQSKEIFPYSTKETLQPRSWGGFQARLWMLICWINALVSPSHRSPACRMVVTTQPSQNCCKHNGAVCMPGLYTLLPPLLQTLGDCVLSGWAHKLCHTNKCPGSAPSCHLVIGPLSTFLISCACLLSCKMKMMVIIAASSRVLGELNVIIYTR